MVARRAPRRGEDRSPLICADRLLVRDDLLYGIVCSSIHLVNPSRRLSDPAWARWTTRCRILRATLSSRQPRRRGRPSARTSSWRPHERATRSATFVAMSISRTEAEPGEGERGGMKVGLRSALYAERFHRPSLDCGKDDVPCTSLAMLHNVATDEEHAAFPGWTEPGFFRSRSRTTTRERLCLVGMEMARARHVARSARFVCRGSAPVHKDDVQFYKFVAELHKCDRQPQAVLSSDCRRPSTMLDVRQARQRASPKRWPRLTSSSRSLSSSSARCENDQLPPRRPRWRTPRSTCLSPSTSVRPQARPSRRCDGRTERASAATFRQRVTEAQWQAEILAALLERDPARLRDQGQLPVS